jgi:hypothetical protein
MTRRTALAILTGAAAAARPPEQATGTLEGLVTNDNRRPIAGVSVKAQHTISGFTHTAATDGDGRYLFSDLAGGTYSLYLAKPGHCSVWIRQVVVRPGETTRRDVTLLEDPICKRGGVS